MTNGLFKYFSTEEFKLETFTSQHVFLTPPKYFNDPWDSLVWRQPQTEEELRARSEGYENERIPKDDNATHLVIPTSDLRDREERFQGHRKRAQSAEYLLEEGAYMREKLSSEFGAVCLAGKPLDRLMWAHYADAHRGFVAEFRTSKEMEWRGRLARECPFGPAIKVVYKDAWPWLQVNKDFTNVCEVCSTKHSKWKDEDEWRVILPLKREVPGSPRARHQPREGKFYYLLKFEPQDLLRVIFGLQVSPTTREQLQEMLARDEFARVRKEMIRIDSASGELITQPFAE